MSVSPNQPLQVVLTYDDYCNLPADGQRYELHEGEVEATPAPSPQHQRVSRELQFLLHAHVKREKLGEVFYAPIDVILSQTSVVQPDIVFVPASRREIVTARGIEAAPELVVEILSWSTEQNDRGWKLQLYARYGVDHYWILDPAARSLAEYSRTDQQYRLRATYLAPTTCRTMLFPALELPLAEIFAEGS